MKKILVFSLLFIPVLLLGQNVQLDNQKFNKKTTTAKGYSTKNKSK